MPREWAKEVSMNNIIGVSILVSVSNGVLVKKEVYSCPSNQTGSLGPSIKSIRN
jgi:hypothetical protein